MTSPIEDIDVACPRCRHSYTAGFRASVNLWLTPMTEDELRHLNDATCPKCEFVVQLESLIASPPEDDGRDDGRRSPLDITGTYPFGAKLRSVVQQDRGPKRVFVLGVYASAVHAKWIGTAGRVLVRALAVASEPSIFWNGEGADRIIEGIDVPAKAGRLAPADAAHNGPSGRSMDSDFLEPLRITRAEAWLCDLVPHTCLNPKQLVAIDREYEPRRHALGLPAVQLPDVPRSFADDARRSEIVAEIEESQAEVIVLLGDQPIRHFLSHFDRRWHRLSDISEGGYGRIHRARIAGVERNVLPLAHPRQVAALGTHSKAWRARHVEWIRTNAPTLLGSR